MSEHRCAETPSRPLALPQTRPDGLQSFKCLACDETFFLISPNHPIADIDLRCPFGCDPLYHGEYYSLSYHPKNTLIKTHPHPSPTTP